VTDTELFDAIEKFIKKNGGLLIHNDGYWECGGHLGLGLRCTGRTLRQALEQLLRPESGKERE